MSLSDNDDIFICVSSSITMNFIDEQTNIHLAVLRTRQVPRSGQDRSGQVSWLSSKFYFPELGQVAFF